MRYLKFCLPFILAFIAGAIYLFTAPAFLLWLDAARFVAAIVTLGIGNPPEPLYVLLAHPFIYLPFGSVIFKIQIFSALTAAVTLVLVYYLTKKLIEEVGGKGSRGSKGERVKVLLSALFSMLMLAFSYQFWSQAQNIETFILVTLIEVVILILLFKSTSKKSVFVNLSLMALILGLATGTNPVIASVIPAILWMMWSRRKYLTIPGWIVWFVIGTAAVIAIHLYIPIRASANPFLNYWRATTLEAVWNASTGAGLNVYVPEIGRINGFTGSPEIFFKSAFHYIEFFFIKFTPILVPFIILGGIFLWKKARYYFYLLIPIILTNFLFSGLYFSGNQESWFLVSDVVFVIMAGLGYFWLMTDFGEIIPARWYKSYNLYKNYNRYLILLTLIPLIFFMPILYRRDWVLTEDYIKNLYQPMGNDKAILFGSSDVYDSISPLIYDVPGTSVYNRNVVPITDNLLYILKWYRENISLHSDLKIPDDSGLKYDSAQEYSGFVNEFFSLNIDTHKIFITIPAARNNFLQAYRGQNLGPSLRIDETKFKLVPQGMLLQVVPKEATDEPVSANFEYQFKSPDFPTKRPKMLEQTYKTELTGIINEYAYSYQSLGDYFLNKGQAEGAFKYYQRAFDLNPKNAEVVSRLGNFYGAVGDHQKAAEFFEKALKIEPKNVGLLFNLAISYENTGRADKAIKNYNQVLQLGKDNPQIVQLAQVRLAALKSATPSAQVATGSGDLQSQLLPKTPAGMGSYQNQALNLAFSYPKGYVVKEEGGVVTLTNKLTGKDELTLNFYGRKMGEGEQVDKLVENLPFKIDGVQLLSQPISLAGFTGVGRTIGSGEHLTFLLLLRRNDQGLVIKLYPGDTSKTEEFNQILSSIRTLK